jgi:hypothetical protein
MMKPARLASALLSAIALMLFDVAAPRFHGQAAAQDPSFQEIRRLWDTQKYSDAFDRLLQYRASAPYGKNEVVDYTARNEVVRAMVQH